MDITKLRDMARAARSFRLYMAARDDTGVAVRAALEVERAATDEVLRLEARAASLASKRNPVLTPEIAERLQLSA